MPEPAQQSLSGLVERVTFHNPENGFCVLKVLVRGEREVVPLIGHASSINPGEWIEASGTWTNDRDHGRQFRALHLAAAPPNSAAGVEKYLGSGMIRGIGPVYAKKLVAAFGVDVLDIIESAPARLREVPGVGPVRAARIATSWADQRAVREIMTFLYSHGVSTARAVRIHKTYGHEAIALIRDNPYRLARDIRGIGFRTADAIAASLGVEKTASIRLRAGVSYALAEAMDDGHCGLPHPDLVATAAALLEAPADLIGAAIRDEVTSGAIIADDLDGAPCLFLPHLHAAEQDIASILLNLRRGQPPWPVIDPSKAIPWAEAKSGLTLAPSQREAVSLALKSKTLVITGGPGVGKTTIVNTILEVLAAKRVEMLLAAPTGRAAKRMSETSGREASTIHRLLGVDPVSKRFLHDERNPLQADLVVIDEASMVDVPLMRALLSAVPQNAALIIVGDTDQLPSVGPGQVLKDIIASGAVPVVRLTEIFRQAAQSRIIAAAHRVNAGALPDLAVPHGPSDFYFFPANEPEGGAALIVDLVKSRIPARFGLDAVSDIQVLCPMNRGCVGARTLNLDLQAALNPSPSAKVERFGWTFAIHDKVMQIENDHDQEVYNGDLGRITAIDEAERQVVINFDGRNITYAFDELDVVVPAYAVTIHKSQGSEYPCIVIPIFTQHFTMLQKNLLYTAITRGRKLVILVGQKKAVGIAVRNASSKRRWSKLCEWLSCDPDASSQQQPADRAFA